MPYFFEITPGPLVILMRHGATEANEGKPVIRAWKDYRLDPDRKSEVVATAHKLEKYKPGYIVSSDLMRDTETANIVADELNLSNRETDFDARTWDMGCYEGQPLEDVNMAIEELYKRPWQAAPGSTESFNDFAVRWQRFLDRKMFLAGNIPAMRPAMIVTHGKDIALSQSYIDAIDPWTARMPLPAGYAVISVDEDRKLSMEIMGKSEPVIEDV